LQARGLRGLRDVDQQLGHLGLAGQLAQQLAQHVLHLVELLLQRLEVDRLGLLGGELLLETVLLVGQRVEAVLLVTDEEVPADQQHGGAHQGGEEDLDRLRPAADVVAVEILQIVEETHDPAPPLAAAALVGVASGAGLATTEAALAGGAASALAVVPSAAGAAGSALEVAAAGSTSVLPASTSSVFGRLSVTSRPNW